MAVASSQQPLPGKVGSDGEQTDFDGATLRVLHGLRSTISDDDSLVSFVIQEFGTDDAGARLQIEQWAMAQWIERRDGRWSLTRQCELIVDQQLAALSTEPEVEGAPAQLRRPYDTAKLKVEQRSISVFQALRKIEKQEIILEPDFQRAFVWDEVRQSRLIESILIRIPLPAFYIDATDSVRWAVVDGLQRLSTLYRFCRVPGFALKGLEFLTELDGKTFSSLPQNYKVLIEDDTQLIFNNLLPETPPKAKFTIFSRVNTGGMQLNAQEIRHALLQGPITKLLKELSSSARFLKTTDRAIDSTRMADRELILRAIAFAKFGTKNYREFDDLNTFLVDAMERFNGEVSAEELRELGERFLVSVEAVKTIFGRYAFRKFGGPGTRRGPINKALFEAMTVAVMNIAERGLLIERKDTVVHGLAALLANDEEFFNAVTYGTGKTSAVQKRFGAVQVLLEKVVQ